MTFVTSPLAEWSKFLDSIDDELGGSHDHVVLQCGCIISESKVEFMADNGSNQVTCPLCQKSTVIIGPVEPLRSISSLLVRKRRELDLRLLTRKEKQIATDSTTLDELSSHNGTIMDSAPTNVDVSLLDTPEVAPKVGLLDLLKKAANQLIPSPTESEPIWTSSSRPVSISSAEGSSVSSEVEIRAFNFLKSFPIYRKQFIHPIKQIHTGILPRNSKWACISSIAPDAKKFVIVGKKKWQVYSIPDDYNDSPRLMHECDISDDNTWYVSMSDNIIVLAGSSSGIIRAYDISSNFKLVYQHNAGFGIHCLAVSNQNSIAVGIVGRDQQSQNQPMIALHYLDLSCSSLDDERSSPSTAKADAKVITVTSPYRDPITTLSFSQDDCFLCCSTYAESRFVVISIVNPLEPRLILKSSRRMDIDNQYEGITSVKFFPNNPRYISVTSVATGASPIILDSKIGTKNAPVASGKTVSAATNLNRPSSSSNSSTGPINSDRPFVIMKVDKVGTEIHRAEISPRGDAVAYLDKSGLVYMMSCPGLLTDFRRITICADVANSKSGHRLASSMRFTPDGQVLLIIDRKGYLHIEDFAAGLPNQAGMGKCRILA